MFRDSLINEILSEPDAQLILNYAQSSLKNEASKRKNFYKIIEEDDKAEFINGDIIFQSPARLIHNVVVKNILKSLDNHVLENNLGFVGSEKLLVTLTRNDYEPDIVFFKKDKSKYFKQDQIQFPAPDFVVEVLSKSTQHIDRGVKFKDYASHNIEEYWIIDADNKSVEQYLLSEGQYSLKKRWKSGIVKSDVVKGFEIKLNNIFNW